MTGPEVNWKKELDIALNKDAMISVPDNVRDRWADDIMSGDLIIIPKSSFSAIASVNKKSLALAELVVISKLLKELLANDGLVIGIKKIGA
jgi:hypothetical protein